MERPYKKWLRTLCASLVALVFFVPIWMMLLGSFKDQGEVLHLDLSFPSQLRIDNYIHVLQTGSILRGYWNSIVITTGTVVLLYLCLQKSILWMG